jgi:hypothetical protein
MKKCEIFYQMYLNFSIFDFCKKCGVCGIQNQAILCRRANAPNIFETGLRKKLLRFEKISKDAIV